MYLQGVTERVGHTLKAAKEVCLKMRSECSRVLRVFQAQRA